MKNLLYGTIFLALIGITFTACEKDIFVFPSETDLTNNEKNQLLDLRKNKPLVFEKINWDYYQKVDGLLSFPIMNNEKVTNRIIVTESTSFVIDYKNWTNEIKLYNFNEENSFAEFSMMLNESLNTYEPIIVKRKNKSKLNACVGSCGISPFYIGVSDGPAPFADIAALVYLGICISQCHDSYGSVTTNVTNSISQ